MEDSSEEDRGCLITLTVAADGQSGVGSRPEPLSSSSSSSAVASSAESGIRCPQGVGGLLTLELTPPDGSQQLVLPGNNRRRSVTSPKLERQEAFAVNDATVVDPAVAAFVVAATAAADAADATVVVRDLYLAVPDLKRDRAASMDSCFVNKPTPAGKPEEVVPASPGQLRLLDPDYGQPANNLRSRSVDIVLPTDQQARYKALSTNNQAVVAAAAAGAPPPTAVPAHKVPPDKGWARLFVHILRPYRPVLLPVIGVVVELGLPVVVKKKTAVWVILRLERSYIV